MEKDFQLQQDTIAKIFSGTFHTHQPPERVKREEELYCSVNSPAITLSGSSWLASGEVFLNELKPTQNIDNYIYHDFIVLKCYEKPIRSTKSEKLQNLFNTWLNDESGYDEKTWPELRSALDESREGERLLFK